ncbi:MAG: prepilin-type N-terminal cleavage/methylation domain-containing protein [Oscillospiraceae bacterium]|nr:prepilin-type N-terminal cleavage/methylation domain-containing protein [Candidatus Limimonas egerieequi]
MLKNKKGFTLVEIVIVIVIIAILAAILVPNLTRWIDKAKIASLKSEADTVRNAVAAQVLSEVKDGSDVAGATEADFGDEFWTELRKEVNKDVQCTDPEKDCYTTFTISNGGLIEFTYSTDGHTATFDGKDWTYE